MPDDVFDHDNRVIHENADREYQGKESDPIKSVAVEVENQESKRQGSWNCDAHDGGFAPTQRQPYQQRNSKDCDSHVEKQLVGFF